jgi:hypothetical protein
MGYVRRRPKRYGANRGLCDRVLEQIHEKQRKTEERAKWHMVPAGTNVEIRKLGSGKRWKSYQTRQTIQWQGYLWRNRTHWGFEQKGYEVKVRVGDFAPAIP